MTIPGSKAGRVLRTRTSGERDARPPSTAPALFEATAAAVPDRPAVAMGTTTLTYAELNTQANRLARRLVANGVGPERLVALAMPRSIEFAVAMLAVHKAGGAYVPVDPDYPEERRRHMLAETSAHCLLCLPGQDVTGAPVVMSVERETGPAEPNLDDRDRLSPLLPDHPAYVIFTSGSTGRPKGVMVTHRGIPNLAADYVHRQNLLPDSRLLAFASPSFDAAVAEFWPIWLAGACLVLAAAPDLIPGDPLARLVRDQHISHVTLPPSALAPLEEGGGLPAGLTLLVAGEACPAPVAKRWARDRVMINAYGPTEATVAVTASDPLTGEDTPPIGRPITGVRTYVLDERLRAVPDGDVGELYMTGPGLARGYLRRPAATAERFLPDPFGSPGERMYRTGDRVRARSDGQLVFVGRADDQLKVRGHRIEPGEVESALLAVDRVAQAAVTEHENRLVAYVVGTAGARVAAEDLLPQLRKRLPSYLVPDVVVGLPRLPTSPNGKVDRAALPDPDGEEPERATSGRAPSTPMEIHLAALFAEVLGVSSVGVEDSFFDVGGHSLLATRLVARIRESLKVRLRVQVFFNAPSVAQLAKVLDGAPT